MCADDPERKSYSLSDDEMKLMNHNDWYMDDLGFFYTPTDIRLENIESDKEFYSDLTKIADQERIIIFTHEWRLDDKNVQKYMTWFAEYASQIGKTFEFPEDRIGQ